MIRGLPHPSMAEVEAASLAELRYWLNNLPGSARPEDHAVERRIVDRIAAFRADPYKRQEATISKPRPLIPHVPLDQPAPVAKPKPKAPKPAPKPAATTTDDAPAGADYFKSLFK